jgi:molybdenum cofactor cytidylyltransferase
LSSLQTALGAVPLDADGFLFTPVDSPTVDEKTAAKLVGMLDEKIVIPRYQGRRGHPVCVPRSLVGAFLALAPTEQTRAAIEQNSDRVEYVDVDDPGILADIDDPEAYRALAQ